MQERAERPNGRGILRRLPAGLLLLLAAGCSGPGEVALSFVFPAGSEETLWLWVRVEERPLEEEGGVVLAADGPLQREPGKPVTVSLGSVPNGEGRRAVVEARAGADVELPVVSYGISEPFAVEAGQRTVVQVTMLAPPQLGLCDPPLEILSGGEPATVIPPVVAHCADLRFRANGPRRLMVANDPSFQAALTLFELEGEGALPRASFEAGEESYGEWLIPCWDLTASLPLVGEGQLTVYARPIDRFGYAGPTVKAAVLLDPVPPVALFGALSTGYAHAGEEVTVEVTFHEPLGEPLELTQLELVPSSPWLSLFGPPVRIGQSHSYRFLAVLAEGDEEEPVAHKLRIRTNDALGNRGEPTLLTGTDGEALELRLDPVPPRLESAKLATVPETRLAGGAIFPGAGLESTILVEFALIEGQELASDSPAVWLKTPLPVRFPQVTGGPTGEAGRYLFSAGLTVADHLDQGVEEGLWPVVVQVEDGAGNRIEGTAVGAGQGPGAALVRIDFTPPRAECRLLPAPGPVPVGAGQKLTLRVSPWEGLAPGVLPELTVEPVVSEGQPGPSFAYLAGSAFDFELEVVAGGEYSVGPVCEGEAGVAADFSVWLELEDEVGNRTPEGQSACSCEPVVAALDGVPPELLALALEAPGEEPGVDGRFHLGVGAKLLARVDLAGAEGVPEVTVGGGAMVCEQAVEQEGPGIRFDCLRELDGSEQEGEAAVAVSAADLAGNPLLQAWQFPDHRFDFSSPMAWCQLNLPVAKAGEEVVILALFSEPLGGPAQLQSDPQSPFAVDCGLAGAGESSWCTFTLPVAPGFPETHFNYAVLAHDAAGNPLDGQTLCSGSGLIDGEPIDMTCPDAELFEAGEGGQFVAKPAAAGARVAPGDRIRVSFATSESPADNGIEVTIGADWQAVPIGQGQTDHLFEYQPAPQPAPGQESRTVMVRVWDGAGNLTERSGETLVFDYQPPFLASVPLFERCDGYAPAQVAANGLWLTDLIDCHYLVGPASCGLPAGPVQSGTARVAFSLSEEILREEAVVEVAGKTLALDPCGSANQLVALYEQSGQEPQGEECREVTAAVRDLAGNASLLKLGCFFFDRVPPARPAVDRFDRIILHRLPSGGLATGGQARFLVQGRVGSVEPATQVGFYDGPEVGTAILLGEATADLQGAFGALPGAAGEVALLPLDRAVVYLRSLDRAGNASDDDGDGANGTQASAIREVHWTTGSAAPPDQQEFQATHRLANRYQEVPAALSPGGALGAADGLALATGAEGLWSLVEGGQAGPGPRLEHGLAWDWTDDRPFLFGGLGVMGRFGDHWSFDGFFWHQLTPVDPEGDGNPEPRSGVALAADPVRRRILLFGGESASGLLGDTWEWDGASWRRRYLSDPEGDGGPAARTGHALAWSPVHGGIVLSGGRTAGGASDESWLCDGASWRKLAPAPAPSPRWGHALAAEPGGGLLLFGGENGQLRYGDSWRLTAAGWQLVDGGDCAAGQRPCPRAGHAMAQEPGGAGTLLVGGQTEAELSAEWWRWSGSGWSRLSPSVPGAGQPAARTGAALVADPGGGRLLLWGGKGKLLPLNDLWEWQGDSWQLLATSNAQAPTARQGHAMVWDGLRQKLVAHGGNDFGPVPGEHSIFGQLFERAGRLWAAQLPTDPEKDGDPEECYSHALAFDGARGRTVLFGGLLPGAWRSGETWEWDGLSWVRRAASDPTGKSRPSPRSGHALAWDAVREATVLFGGQDDLLQRSDESWEWDGEQWLERQPTDPEGDGNPAARDRHCLVYDVERQVTVLFGGRDGQGPLADLWEWDGQSWRLGDGGSGPTARSGAAAAYDSLRGRVVVAGGMTAAGASDEVWEWDGQSWEQRLPVAGGLYRHPEPFYLGAAAYDESEEALVLFGGLTGGLPAAGCWEWFRGSSRAGHLFRTRLAASGIGPQDSPFQVTVLWHGGGREFPGGQPLCGTELAVFDANSWRSAATGKACPEEPQGLSWQCSDPRRLALDRERLFDGPERELALALTTGAQTGAELGRVASDYLEVTIAWWRGETLGFEFAMSGDSEGWNMVNLPPTLPAGGSWLLPLGSGQPQLLSPLLLFQAESFSRLLLRTRTTAAGGKFRFRWRHLNSATFADTTFVELTVPGDGQWHELELPITKANWKGKIVQLRLDLPAGVAGSEVELDRLRLLE